MVIILQQQPLPPAWLPLISKFGSSEVKRCCDLEQCYNVFYVFHEKYIRNHVYVATHIKVWIELGGKDIEC